MILIHTIFYLSEHELIKTGTQFICNSMLFTNKIWLLALVWSWSSLVLVQDLLGWSKSPVPGPGPSPDSPDESTVSRFPVS